MLSVDIEKKIKSVKGDRILKVSGTFSQEVISGVYGNSGVGKSTLFNCLSGLSNPTKGIITHRDEIWFNKESEVNIPPQNRNIGYIFQGNSLFPHFTVKENILYAVRKEHINDLDLSSLLSQVEMEGMENRYPYQLSGGQLQRVAIARSLAQKSKLILMDEPFSALDLEIKQKLYKLIKFFKEQYELMILIITHDINDILYLCDEVLWVKEHQADGLLKKGVFKKEIESKLKLL